MTEIPKITNDKLFIAKIYEAICLATNFQVGSGTTVINDWMVRVPNKEGDYALKIEFVKNATTL